jgi:tetratricopeptide (TPR) repeat protein
MGIEEYEKVLNLMLEAEDAGYEGPLIYERKADALCHLERYAEAIPLLKACANDPETEDTLHDLFLLGRCYMAVNDYKNAVQCFEDILLEVDHNETIFLSGMCYYFLGNKDRMTSAFDKLIHNEEYQELILEFLTVQDDSDLFIRFVGQAGLDQVTDAVLRARHFILKDDLYMASGFLEDAAKTNDVDELYLLLAYIYTQMGNPAKARKNALAVLKKACPDKMEPEELTRRLHALELADYSPGYVRRHINKFYPSCKSNPGCVLMLADTCLRHDNAPLAYQMLEELDEDELDIEMREDKEQMVIAAALGVGNYDEAYALLEKKGECDDREYQKSRTIASFYTGRSDEALERALKLMPDGIAAIIAFLIYDESGRTDKAAGILEQMESAISQDKEIDDIDNFIGFLESMAQDTV